MMKSRFSHLLTMALAVGCGLLLLLLFLFELGTGRGYKWWPPEAADVLAMHSQLDHSTFKLPDWNEFADVNTRPLFNEDRKPTPPAPPVTATNEKPPPKLNITLTGVVMTPKVNMAMIVENGKTESSAIREGHALPGELAAWSLAKVKPRGATFRSSAGEEVEVELIAKGNGQKPVPPTTAAAPAPAPATMPAPAPAHAQVPPGKQPEQNAELQNRIEARRKQLKEQQAAHTKEEGNPAPEEPASGG